VAKVVFQDESLEIDISLIDRLLGFHGSFHIPLAHVTNAYVSSLEVWNCSTSSKGRTPASTSPSASSRTRKV